MTRTIRRYQLPHPDEDGKMVLDLPGDVWAFLVEEIASTPYLVAIVDEDTKPLPCVVWARRANQEAPPCTLFLGAIGIHYFFWQGQP